VVAVLFFNEIFFFFLNRVRLETSLFQRVILVTPDSETTWYVAWRDPSHRAAGPPFSLLSSLDLGKRIEVPFRITIFSLSPFSDCP